MADSEIVVNFAAEMIEMIAYHGTTRDSAELILNEGFTFSLGNEHWLGDGAYFFVRGVGYAPERAAELWAEYRAYKQQNQFCALMEANIRVDEERMEVIRMRLEDVKQKVDSYLDSISAKELLQKLTEKHGMSDYDMNSIEDNANVRLADSSQIA